MNNRLIEFMNAFEITQNDICARLGIPKSTMSMYVSGKRELRSDKAQLIARAYNVSPAWLMGFDVPMQEGADYNVDPRQKTVLEIRAECEKMDNAKLSLVLALIKSMNGGDAR